MKRLNKEKRECKERRMAWPAERNERVREGARAGEREFVAEERSDTRRQRLREVHEERGTEREIGDE